MARVALVPKESLPEPLRAQWKAVCAYAPFEQMLGAFANRTPIFEHLFAMQAELRRERRLSPRHWELVQVVVSQLNACTYCVARHEPLLAAHGLSEAGVARLHDYENHPELDAVDKLVVATARAVTEAPQRVPDALIDSLRGVFDDSQIVELIWEIALCGAFNRFNGALALETEATADAD